MARRTQGTLTLAINLGGKVLYLGQASLDAVRSGRVPLTLVNNAFLQSVDPELGFGWQLERVRSPFMKSLP